MLLSCLTHSFVLTSNGYSFLTVFPHLLLCVCVCVCVCVLCVCVVQMCVCGQICVCVCVCVCWMHIIAFIEILLFFSSLLSMNFKHNIISFVINVWHKKGSLKLSTPIFSSRFIFDFTSLIICKIHGHIRVNTLRWYKKIVYPNVSFSFIYINWVILLVTAFVKNKTKKKRKQDLKCQQKW